MLEWRWRASSKGKGEPAKASQHEMQDFDADCAASDVASAFSTPDGRRMIPTVEGQYGARANMKKNTAAAQVSVGDEVRGRLSKYTGEGWEVEVVDWYGIKLYTAYLPDENAPTDADALQARVGVVCTVVDVEVELEDVILQLQSVVVLPSSAVGALCDLTVEHITQFGAFVVGVCNGVPIRALLHRSRIPLREFNGLRRGDNIEVVIEDIDNSNYLISTRYVDDSKGAVLLLKDENHKLTSIWPGMPCESVVTEVRATYYKVRIYCLRMNRAIGCGILHRNKMLRSTWEADALRPGDSLYTVMHDYQPDGTRLQVRETASRLEWMQETPVGAKVLGTIKSIKSYGCCLAVIDKHDREVGFGLLHR